MQENMELMLEEKNTKLSINIPFFAVANIYLGKKYNEIMVDINVHQIFITLL